MIAISEDIHTRIVLSIHTHMVNHVVNHMVNNETIDFRLKRAHADGTGSSSGGSAGGEHKKNVITVGNT